jgi:hypothetical protein
MLKEIFYRILGLFGLGRRRKEKWGTIYNIHTGQPVPMARVSIVDQATGKVKKTKITDKHGSYYFLTPPGSYRLQVSKKGFRPYTGHLEKLGNRYADNYQIGETLQIQESSKIDKNIPLEKTTTQKEKHLPGKILRIITNIFFFLGLSINLLMLIKAPDLLNFFLFLLYLLMAGVQYFYLGSGKWGEVVNSQGKPQGFAIIRLYDRETNQRVSRVVTDQKGRYFLIANPGEYLLQVRTVGSQAPDLEKEINLKRRSSIVEKLKV